MECELLYERNLVLDMRDIWAQISLRCEWPSEKAEWRFDAEDCDCRSLFDDDVGKAFGTIAPPKPCKLCSLLIYLSICPCTCYVKHS